MMPKRPPNRWVASDGRTWNVGDPEPPRSMAQRAPGLIVLLAALVVACALGVRACSADPPPWACAALPLSAWPCYNAGDPPQVASRGSHA